jgi:hypothetical protein
MTALDGEESKRQELMIQNPYRQQVARGPNSLKIRQTIATLRVLGQTLAFLQTLASIKGWGSTPWKPLK